MQDIRVASVQMESVAGDKAANFEKVERFTAEAAARGARIVLFPECNLTGYWPRSSSRARDGSGSRRAVRTSTAS